MYMPYAYFVEISTTDMGLLGTSVSLLGVLLAVLGYLVWTGVDLGPLNPLAQVVKPYLEQVSTEQPTERLFTSQQLSKYTGKSGSPELYLAIMGKVFDVTKGERYYGLKGGYSFFTGRDGTRAFVTGDFTEAGLVDNVDGLEWRDLIGIEEWVQTYEKEYKYAGKLIGRYYDKEGNPTKELLDVEEKMKAAHSEKNAEEERKKAFPSCDSVYTEEDGPKFVCSRESGGIERDWVGVPRKLYKPDSDKYRCICVKNTGPPAGDPGATEHSDRGDLDNPLVQVEEFNGCPSDETACKP
ncbi:neuferricin-like [Branchiostoma lanceolatum]|uniref:neuferricin-like n=1 Tax=Branchiostoma lanceolatum TaxID=7740 RepID=UPI0034520265